LTQPVNPQRRDHVHEVQISHAVLIERAQNIRTLFSHHAIRLPPSSRIANYVRTVEVVAEKVNTKQSVSPREFALAAQALYEIAQLTLIISQLSRPPETVGWKDILQNVVAGRDLPQDDPEPRQARNLQFQLFITALAKMVASVELQEPDAVVQAQDLTFTIAAKRPRSMRHINRIFEDAKRQIERKGLPGLLAIDLTQIVNPLNHIRSIEEPSQATPIVRQAAEQFGQDQVATMAQIAANGNMFACMIHASGRFFIAMNNTLGIARHVHTIPICTSPDPRLVGLSGFLQAMYTAYDNQSDWP
jgi:hypothetical protein